MILPVTLLCNNQKIRTYAMLDSGAKGYAYINESFAT